MTRPPITMPNGTREPIAQKLAAALMVHPRATEHEFTLLKAILASETEKKGARNLKECSAVYFMDFLCEVLRSVHGRKEHPMWIYRSAIRRLLSNVAKESNKLPSNLPLHGIHVADRSRPACFSGFSDIFRGTWQGKAVCVKRLRLSQSDNTQGIMRDLRREAVKCWTLIHPNLLRFLGVEEKDGMYSLISPWMDHGSLFDYQRRQLRQSPASIISSKKLLSLLCQVMNALEYLHHENLVHADMRADNVLIDDDFNARLCDLGLSIFIDATNGVQSKFGRSVRFQGPEQFDADQRSDTQENDQDESKRSKEADIFAFSYTVIQAFTVELPFPGKKNHFQVAMMTYHGVRPPRPDQRACHGRMLPDALWSLLEQCWGADPQSRPPAAQVHAALDCINKATE